MNLTKILFFEDSKISNYKILYTLLILLLLSSVINISARLIEKNLWEENEIGELFFEYTPTEVIFKKFKESVLSRSLSK